MEFHSVNKLLEKSIKENWEREALSNYQCIRLRQTGVFLQIMANVQILLQVSARSTQALIWLFR